MNSTICMIKRSWELNNADLVTLVKLQTFKKRTNTQYFAQNNHFEKKKTKKRICYLNTKFAFLLILKNSAGSQNKTDLV